MYPVVLKYSICISLQFYLTFVLICTFHIFPLLHSFWIMLSRALKLSGPYASLVIRIGIQIFDISTLDLELRHLEFAEFGQDW